MAQIIDGKSIASEMQEEMKSEVEKLRSEGIIPGLAAVLVGDDPASAAYVRNKENDCLRVGIKSDIRRLPAGLTEKELLDVIRELNNDNSIHGIIVQLPLPGHINDRRILLAIDPEKDVDGFHPLNVGKMVIGEPGFLPCTPHACKVLLEKAGIETRGKHIVILGRSNIVGKPLANMMMRKEKGADAIVTVCHSSAPDITFYTRQADILVAAVGKAKLVTADMVKEGVVVIDVGINSIEDPYANTGRRLVGDVDYDSVFPKARAITPVPGGVGPMTRTMLLHNTITSAKRKIG